MMVREIRSQPKAAEILMKENSCCRVEFKANNQTKSPVPHQLCQHIFKGATVFTDLKKYTLLKFYYLLKSLFKKVFWKQHYFEISGSM